MKKGINLFLICIFVLVCFIKITSVHALSVSKNNLTIDSGKSTTVKLYANTDEKVSKIDFTLVFSTYDISADFIVDSKYSDKISGIRHSITLDQEKSGEILLGTINIDVVDNPTDSSGIVNIHTASAIGSDEKVINLKSQVINVKVNMPKPNVTVDNDDVDKGQLLLKIDSKLTKIDIKEDVFEYSVIIPDDVVELDLQPVAKDKSSKIDISTQKIAELKDGKIVIVVTNNNRKEEYTVNVKVKKEEEKKSITIDEDEFVDDSGYKKKWLLVLFLSITVLVVSSLFMKRK